MARGRHEQRNHRWPGSSSVVAVPLAFAVLALSPTGAAAHGPCDCLSPSMVPAGQTVKVGPQHGGMAYRAVLNPRPGELGIAPGYLSSAYQPAAATTELLSGTPSRPARQPTLRIPNSTPAGLYLLLIWDGAEGGAHNTWDYIHVTDPNGANGQTVPRQEIRRVWRVGSVR